MTDNDAVANATLALDVQRYDGARLYDAVDQIVQELPIAFVINGISHAVMMATPADLEDFAIGFCLSERIVEQRRQIYDVIVTHTKVPQNLTAISLEITIASTCFARLKEQRRAFVGRTGCGLCGVDSLAALNMDLPRVSMTGKVPAARVLCALKSLPQYQAINALTGAVHAAAWVSLSDQVASDAMLIREDVGRHNALDKLIGARADLIGHAAESGFVIMTSRASYELVQKAACANIALLATISAPTALAIESAARAGICLIGFARDKRCVVYTDTQHLFIA